ncbi:toxin glutamine deamidase domain-containing protein [Streptomyces sp. NPDC046805]|uniref:toxin glutamine deamidase domain-containing protein n=1 Tax=Streptomyces sp. NPDC046805 TaxID=3155134 RepID=UPI0033D7793E
MMLPDELEWVLEMLGYRWPTADEDKLREAAALWRKFGDDVTELHTAANGSARKVTAYNAGASIDAFTKTYAKFDGGGGSDGYLANAAQAAYTIATVLEACALAVEVAKWAVIAQLVALAFEIAAAQASAPFTFGLSEAGALGATQVTRLIVRRLLDELKKALMEAITEAMKEPAISAVEAIITDLVKQTVNVGFGAQQGYNVGQTVKAGADAGGQALLQTPQTLAEGVRDSLGEKAGHRFHHAIDSRIEGHGSSSGSDGGDGGDGDGGSEGESDSSSGSPSGSASDSSSTSSDGSGASGSSGSDSSPSTTHAHSGAGTHIGGGISADTGGLSVSTPDVGVGPDSASGSDVDSGSVQGPLASDSAVPRPTPSLSGPTLSDFDDPAPDGPSHHAPDLPDLSGSPSHSGSSGGSSPSGVSSPTPHSTHSTHASAPSGDTTPSTGSGGGISTSIDSLAATVPTQSHAPDTPPPADPSPTGTGSSRTDIGSAIPTPPVTPSTTPAHTPNPTPDGRIPNQRVPGTAPGDGTLPRHTPGDTPSDGRPPRDTPDARTPRTTPNPTPDGRTPGSTPGERTSPRNSPDPTGTRASTPSHDSSSGPRSTTRETTANRTQTQTPQSSPPRPTPAPSADSNAPSTAPNRPSAPSSTTPTPSTRPAPGDTPGAPGTPNRPSTGSTPTRPPQQPTGSTPNTPQAPSGTATNLPSEQQQQHQQQQATPVPVPTVIPGARPSTPLPSHASPAAPHAPGAPQAAPGMPQHHQQSQQESLNDIRSGLDHHPGGLADPHPDDQQALADAVPHNPDGTPQRFPDPFGHWAQLQNDGGNQVPGRSNNCADCSRSFLETWYGNPQVSAPRTLDTDEHGNPDPWSPEDNANDNQIRWTGAEHAYAGPGNNPDTANTIASTLQQAGHGAAAIVQVDWPGGGGHAFNAVNHHGDIVWIDTQSGEVSHDPLHIADAEHVWHIPLDANRHPVDLTRSDADHSESRNDESQSKSSEINGHPENNQNPQTDVSGNTPPQGDDTDTGTDSTKPARLTIDASNNADPTQPPASGDREGDNGRRPQSESDNPSKPDGRPHGREPSQQTPSTPRQQSRPGEVTRPDEQGRTRDKGSDQPTTTTERPARPESPGATNDNTDGQDNKPYTAPHDRGDSDTSDESRRVTEDGPDSDTSRTHAEHEAPDAREYGIEPDQLQTTLREQRDVHRVDLDRVHDRLDRWAESGELTNVLRAASGDGPHPSPDGPRSFTRAQLSQSLEGFDRLSRGEQQAVVASLARLSLSYHKAHSVGANPERISHPYRGENEGDPAPRTPDRGAKISKESLGVRLHRMALNQLFKKASFKKLPSDEAGKVRRSGPDFSGKNFAVLEVQGPPPDHDVTYVVDSSVPANQKLPGVQPRHSEKHLLAWLQRMDPEGKKYTPLGLYTEREPCGQGEGHMRCSTVLLDDRFEGIPIHYSTTYRDDPEGIAIRKQMRSEKRETLKTLNGMSDDKIKEHMTERWSKRYKDDEKRLARALNRLEGKSGTKLIESITNELDAQRDEARTLKEQAVKAEFDRHVDALEKTWNTILPDLKK